MFKPYIENPVKSRPFSGVKTEVEIIPSVNSNEFDSDPAPLVSDP
jgi:hypothetical protein